MKVYVGKEVPNHITTTLLDLGCIVRLMPHDIDGGGHGIFQGRRLLSKLGMFWRFLTINDPDAEHVIFRDCDSRLNSREKAAVEQWIQSGTLCHVMHDHPAHVRPIMGSAWGLKGWAVNISELLDTWTFTGKYGDDENFLAEKVWPLVSHSTLAHGNNGIPFPASDYNSYVGEIINI